tara:strand:- start:429 stop:584 length:156 start_codon:yes stop_codon:yes gene_type:complete
MTKSSGKRIKTRFHKILFDQDSPYRAKVIPNKKKKNPRKENKKLINTLIEE